MLHKGKKIKPKNKISGLVRTAEYKEIFLKCDTTNWSYKLCITEIFNDTIASYRIDKIPERYNEALLKKTELKKKETQDVIKA